jgi:hypothetical protein
MTKPYDRFFGLYHTGLKRLATRVARADADLIVAISRKGPRLLALIDQHSELPSIPWDRCVTEKALPYYQDHELQQRAALLMDDTIIFGSTFAGVGQDLEHLGARVDGVVLSISTEADESVRQSVSSPLVIRPKEIAELIDLEVQAFGLLGLPYDVDHPIIEFNFADVKEGHAQELMSEVPGLEDCTQRWQAAHGTSALSIRCLDLVSQHSLSGHLYGPATIRVFVDSIHNKVRIVPIFCVALRESEIENDTLFQNSPPPLGRLWTLARNQAASAPLGIPRRNRALMNAAHYLASFELGLRWLANTESLCSVDYRVSSLDLALLFGHQLAAQWLPPLMDSLSSIASSDYSASDDTDELFEALHPSDELLALTKDQRGRSFFARANNYLALTTSREPRDALSAILEAQRWSWDEMTREKGPINSTRLDVALTYPAVRTMMELSGVPMSDAGFQNCCNSAIDSGAIVPRYVRISNDQLVWARGSGLVRTCPKTTNCGIGSTTVSGVPRVHLPEPTKR